MIVYRLFLPAHYCYYSGLTVLNKDFIHSFIPKFNPKAEPTP